MSTVQEILRIFHERGAAQYFGEDVTELEHALQAATFAERANCPETLITAALLHDFGHLIHGLPEDIANQGIDARHETLGEAWLARYFGPAVTEPVRLHVMAKRYLCVTYADYRNELSPSSVQSLQLQGGPLSSEELREFESNPFFRDAVQLRRFDDQAKVVGMQTPGLEHFAEYLRRAQAAACSS